MSIKDGLNWLKKQAAGLGEQGSFPISPAHTLNYSAPTTVEPNIDLGLDMAPDGEDPTSFDASSLGQQPPTTPIPMANRPVVDTFKDQAVHMHHGNPSPEERIQNSELGTGDMSPSLPGLQQDMEDAARQPQPATNSGRIPYTGGNPAIDPAVANQGIVSNDTGDGTSRTSAMPTEFAPAPSVPTTAATMADGPEMPSVGTHEFPEWQDKPAPAPSVPTTAATMADGPGEIQSEFLNGNSGSTTQPAQPAQPAQPQAQSQAQQQPAPSSGGIPSSNATVAPDVMEQGIVSQPPANSAGTPGSILTGRAATAQTQAMPNGSADYSRIFGKGFNAASGSASDKWLAGQADKLRTAGYSDNQISTMLDINAWKRYGRNGQDYQVDTKRYTKPLGMKSASATDALWAKQAGLNDEFDDLYVRRLRVGLWDKYNG